MSDHPRSEQEQKTHREYMRWYMQQKRAANPQEASAYERKRRLRHSFLSKEDGSARARELVQAERCIAGEVFIGTAAAAKLSGISCTRLRVLAREHPGINRVLTLKNGWRFIRLPRHDGDMRAPLFWAIG